MSSLIKKRRNKIVMRQEVKMKLGEKAFRVNKAVCPHCGLKMHKMIENKSLFDGSLTFHIIKLKCEKCAREYLDLEQAQVYDLFLIFNKMYAHKSLETLTEKFSQRMPLKRM